MKTQRTWPYLSLVALIGLAGCSSSRQTAQNTGEMDDLYASSANATVYEGTRQPTQPTERVQTTGTNPRQWQRQADTRNTNPDYTVNDEQRGYDANKDEYYTELSTRNIKRGLSADPGWSNSNYNDGFTEGYYAGMGNPSYNSARWNPWGYGGGGFNTGLSLGFGLGSAFGGGWGNQWGGYNSWNRFGGGFHDPFYGGGFNSYGYNPWGYGGGFGGGFGSPYGYNPYNSYYGGGFNSWGGYGGGWGGNGRTVIVNNTIVTGADPYRNNRTSGARGTAPTNRYNGDFNNTPRNTGNAGGRQANGNTGSTPAYSGNAGPAGSGATSTGSSDGYYARPRQNSQGSYYYENGGSAPAPSGNSSRTGSTPNSTYNNNSGNSSNGGYYSAPRQNSRGTYSAPSDNGGGTRNSQPSYQAPQQQQRSNYESRPGYQAPQQQSQPSYSAPSSDGGSRGGGSSSSPSSSGGSSSGGGGSRGPR